MLPLVDNRASDRIWLEIHVYTGFKNKGTSKSNVSFILTGTDGDTGVRQLKDGVRNVHHSSI